jgi:hypothetical protein
MKRYVLDSFAMIAFYEDEAGADITERILKDITSKKAEGFMSIINWGEIYYSTIRCRQGINLPGGKIKGTIQNCLRGLFCRRALLPVKSYAGYRRP